MSPMLRNLILILILGALFVEFGYQVIQSDKKTAEESPIDKNGMIKEGKTVSFEKEEQLAISSFPTVEEQDYVENMLYAFGQCMISAPVIGENSFSCLSNNVANEALKGLSDMESDLDRGKYILQQLTKGNSVTNITVVPLNKEESLHFMLTLSLNNDSDTVRYEVLIEQRKIVSITELRDTTKEEKENEA